MTTLDHKYFIFIDNPTVMCINVKINVFNSDGPLMFPSGSKTLTGRDSKYDSAECGDTNALSREGKVQNTDGDGRCA
jgi:hypothetical protein